MGAPLRRIPLCLRQPASRSPADSCWLRRDPGPCSGMLSRFFYNSSSMACETFLYGGCLGNGNNFYSEKECLQACRTEGERGHQETSLQGTGGAFAEASEQI